MPDAHGIHLLTRLNTCHASGKQRCVYNVQRCFLYLFVVRPASPVGILSAALRTGVSTRPENVCLCGVTRSNAGFNLKAGASSISNRTGYRHVCLLTRGNKELG